MAEVIQPESHAQTTNGTSTKSASVKVESRTVYPEFQAPPGLPRPPFVDVEGIPNFRDVGGYICSPYGKKHSHIVRPSFVYRCAVPTSVTSHGMTQLSQDLNVSAIYDLRSAPEVNRTPNLHDTPLKTLHHFTPVYETEDYSPDALARKLKWYSASPSSTNTPTSESDLPPYSLGFLNAYRDISTHGVPAYRTIFTHILTQPSSPLVFHCTAGKDRTGVLAALMLRLAGVDDDTICWEYALTEPGLGFWRDVFMERIAKNGLGGGHAPKQTTVDGVVEQEVVTKEEAGRICGSRSNNMRAYLRLVLDAEFGGAENYLVSKLGFSSAEVERIRSALVVPVGVAGDGEMVKMVEIPGWTPEGGVTDEFERLPKENGVAK